MRNKRLYDKIRGGSVAEWLKAHDSKSCGLATVSEVRILSLPPNIEKDPHGGLFKRLYNIGSEN